MSLLTSAATKKDWFWKGCKPISVCVLANGENHLSQQPIPETCLLSQTRNEPLLGFLFGLAPDGVFRAPPITRRAVGSYPTFSPLPASLAKRRRYILCGTVRRKSLTAPPPVSIPPEQAWVTRHRALRSSDFPPRAEARSDSPPFQDRP